MCNFKQGLAIGADGERKTERLLRSLGYEVYRCNGEDDCDFYIKSSDKDLMTLAGYYRNKEPARPPLIQVEAKRDLRADETGNLAFEIMSSARNFAPGGILKTQAHLLVYVTDSTIYLINRAQFLSWLIIQLSEGQRFRVVCAHDNRHVRSMLVPIDHLLDSKVDTQVFPVMEK